MGFKTDEVEFATAKSVPEIGRALQDVLRAANAQSIDPVQSGSGALSEFDDRADIEIVAEGQSLLGGRWVVQAYVFDQGHQRVVKLIALGDGGFSRAMNGARNTVALGGSIKKRNDVADALR